MLDAKEVVKRAYNAASIDAKQKKIATEVLNILSSNGTTVSEAITILNAVEKMITGARLDLLKLSQDG